MIIFLNDIYDVVSVVLIVVISLLYLFSANRKVNDSAATELIANLQKLRETDRQDFNNRLKILEDQRLEDTKAIAEMQGQIKVYKELPLRELADGIKEVVVISKDNAESNKQILEQLKSTAKIAAEDRDVLTNSNKHIKTEVHKEIEKNR